MKHLLFSLSALMMMCSLAMSAQSNHDNVKLVTADKLPEIYSMADIESITFERHTLDVPSLEQVTLDDLSQLILKTYPEESPAMICELGSDNLIDNNAFMDGENNMTNSGLYDKLFVWKNVPSGASYEDGEDSPLAVWRSYLKAIAICDYILEAADAIETREPSLKTSLKPYKAEALITRSYLRSVLTNVFDVDFSEAIAEDLQAGLQLIDYLQDADASRMTRRAANAYAARHYLMEHDWAKVEQYATAALGDNPASMLRNWNEFTGMTDIRNKLAAYYNAAAPCNFYVQKTYSLRDRVLASGRYATNGNSQEVLYGNGPQWANWLPCFYNNLYAFKGNEYGCWLFRAYEFFEYTDEEAHVGHVINMYTPFTAEETLLMRAEARFYRGLTDDCLSDLNLWLQSKQVSLTLQSSDISDYYTPDSHPLLINDIHMDVTGWSQTDINTATQNKPLLDCLLHFRRIETIYDGLRWNDLRRYGINIQHEQRQPYADAQFFDSNYHYDAPAGLDATDEFLVSLHMKDQSIVTTTAEQILYGGNNEADKAAKESFIPSENGWVLYTYDTWDYQMNTSYFSQEKCEIVGEGLMSLGANTDATGIIHTHLYRILKEKAGEEYLLQDMSDDSDYPTINYLIPCTMPWEEYQEKCEQAHRDLWIADILRCGDIYMKEQSPYILFSHSPEFTELIGRSTFVYTPTGIRLFNADFLTCDSEFVLDVENNTLTSKDGTLSFVPDIDSSLQNLLTTTASQYEITIDETNTELLSAVESLKAAIPSYNANFTFKNLYLGRSTGSNAQNGIGFYCYTNAAQTKSGNFGVETSFKCHNGNITLATPGVAEGTPNMSRTLQVITNKEDIKIAVLSLLSVMEGDYTYTVEGIQTGYVNGNRTIIGFGNVRMTKVSNPAFTFTVSIQ